MTPASPRHGTPSFNQRHLHLSRLLRDQLGCPDMAVFQLSLGEKVSHNTNPMGVGDGNDDAEGMSIETPVVLLVTGDGCELHFKSTARPLKDMHLAE